MHRKDILLLGGGRTKRLDDTTLTAEAIYPINFKQPRKGFVFSLHYNESESFFFVTAAKVYQIKAKKLRNIRLCTVFRSHFKRFYN